MHLQLRVHDFVPELLEPEKMSQTAERCRDALRRLQRLPFDRALVARTLEFALETAASMDLTAALARALEVTGDVAAACSSGKSDAIALGEHRLVARHDPTVQLIVDGVPQLTFQVNVRVELLIDCAVVQVRSGRISSIDLGTLTAQAVLGIEGQDLHTQNLGVIHLPGTIRFESEPARAPTRRPPPLRRRTPVTAGRNPFEAR
jgi:hypothetical protein